MGYVNTATVAIPAVLAAGLVAYRLFNRRRSTALPLCSPRDRSWFWGHERAAFAEEAGQWYLRWFDEFGPAFKLNEAIDGNEVVVIADPTALNHIYVKRSYDYPTSEYMVPFLGKLIGHSLVWAQGDTHAAMRRLLNPVFSSEHVKLYADDIVESWSRFEAKLVERLATDGGTAEINAPHWYRIPALDVIGRVAFNHDFGCGEHEEAKAIWDRFGDYLKSNLTNQGLIAANIPRLIPAVVHLPIPALESQKYTRQLVHRLGRDMFSREKEAQDRLAHGYDILSILMRQRAMMHGDQQVTDEMLDHVTTFVMAGHETVATAVSTAIWLLGKHPEVQERLRQEALSFPGIPTYDDFSGVALPFLDAVTKETLRVYPGAGMVERVAARDDVIPLRFPVRSPDGSYIHAIPVRAGQKILVPNPAVDKLKCVWGADGNVWRPERWLEPDTLPPLDMLNLGWGRTFSFSQGPRSCIGYRLALYEMKYFLFATMRMFRVSDTGAQVLRLTHKGVLPPQGLIVGRESEGMNYPVRFTLL